MINIFTRLFVHIPTAKILDDNSFSTYTGALHKGRDSMMEQLWYTWSSLGLGTTTGFRIRAATKRILTLSESRWKRLKQFLHYTLPPGLSPHTTEADAAPINLALHKNGDERLLMHTSYVGKDAFGTPGVFFTHMLTGLPQNYLAYAAIQLWDSSFWVREDPDDFLTTTLPTVAVGKLDPGLLQQETLELVKEYLPLVINAFFSLAPGEKIYIAAPDYQVAALIWGLTRCVPYTLQQEITFCTYEADIASSPTLITGTCTALPEMLSETFPTTYKHEQGFAINCYEFPPEWASSNTIAGNYALFAAASLLDENTALLIDLLEGSETLNIQTKERFLKYSQPAISLVTDNDVQHTLTEIIRQKELSIIYLNNPDIQDLLIAEVLHSSEWWFEQTKQIALIQKTEENETETSTDEIVQNIINSISMKIIHEARKYLIAGDNTNWHALIDLLEDLSDASQQTTIWITLLKQQGKFLLAKGNYARTFGLWSTRLRLLQQWAKIQEHIQDSQLLSPWFPSEWDELREFLTMPMPEDWHMQAIIITLVESMNNTRNIPDNLTEIVEENAEKYHQAFEMLLEDPETANIAFTFFEILVHHGYQKKMPLLIHLLNHPQVSTEIPLLLQTATLNEQEENTIIKNCTKTILGQINTSRIAADMLENYLDNYPLYATKIDEHDRKTLLTLAMYKEQLPLVQAKQVRDYVLTKEIAITSALKIDPPSLAKVATTIQHLSLHKYPQYMNQFYRQLNLSANYDEQQLLSIITTIASCFQIDKKDILQKLTLIVKEDNIANEEQRMHYVQLVQHIDDGPETEIWKDRIYQLLFQEVTKPKEDLEEKIKQIPTSYSGTPQNNPTSLKPQLERKKLFSEGSGKEQRVTSPVRNQGDDVEGRLDKEQGNSLRKIYDNRINTHTLSSKKENGPAEGNITATPQPVTPTNNSNSPVDKNITATPQPVTPIHKNNSPVDKNIASTPPATPIHKNNSPVDNTIPPSPRSTPLTNTEQQQTPTAHKDSLFYGATTSALPEVKSERQSSWIARVYGEPITWPQLETLYKLKDLYIPQRQMELGVVEKNERDGRPTHVSYEREFLYKCIDRRKSPEEILDILKDVLIGDTIMKNEIEDMPEQTKNTLLDQIIFHLQQIKQKENFQLDSKRLLERKNMQDITDQDVDEVLIIFLRNRIFMARLFHLTKENFFTWLEKAKKKVDLEEAPY